MNILIKHKQTQTINIKGTDNFMTKDIIQGTNLLRTGEKDVRRETIVQAT